jgi:hypothetical protein
MYIIRQAGQPVQLYNRYNAGKYGQLWHPCQPSQNCPAIKIKAATHGHTRPFRPVRPTMHLPRVASLRKTTRATGDTSPASQVSEDVLTGSALHATPASRASTGIPWIHSSLATQTASKSREDRQDRPAREASPGRRTPAAYLAGAVHTF